MAAVHKSPSLTTKSQLMKFYSKFIDKHLTNKKPLYDLLQDNVKFHWSKDLETMNQQIGTSAAKKLLWHYLIQIIQALPV